MDNLRRKHGVFRVDMCAYNLVCPDSNLPIRKATGLMTSKRTIAQHMKQRPGCASHQTVQGRLSNGMLRSAFVSRYTPQFVEAVLNAFAAEGCREFEPVQSVHLVDLEVECLVNESDGPMPEAASPQEHVEDERPEPKIMSAVRKLHKNLGHPSADDLVRMLKHAKASSEAIEAAKTLQCTVCANHQQPSAALPSNVPRILDFNAQVGLDVKCLPGWQANQTIPCVSIDYATGLHVMTPIFRKETSELIKGVLRDSWISWAGPPEYLVTDPANFNISEAMAEFCQNMGIKQTHTAADAHYQLGKVERRGKWFQRILERVCDHVHPTDGDSWVDCVIQTQTAKNSLISQSGASPFQLVFGRNPRVPHDMLQDEPDAAASDAVVLDSALARAQQVRRAARAAVLEAQDSRALRAALHAWPTPHKEFQSGGWVF